MTTTFRAKTPEDILAAVPVVLGFEPRSSVVMLTFGAAAPFHARIDLPARGDPDAVGVLSATLLAPCHRHRVERVLFVLYDASAALARRLARRLRGDFEACDIEVVECLRVDDGRWFCAEGRRGDVPAEGVPCNPGAHPFRAQAVLDGRVTLGSRDDLAASIAPDEKAISRVEAAVASAAVLSPDGLGGLCRQHATDGTAPDDATLAAMLLTVQIGCLRDGAWVWLTREAAPGHVALWSDAVRRAPADLMPSAAAVLAFAAWLEGHGALAWCALDRCFAEDPDHSLGRLVADMLAAAHPPTAWKPLTEDGDGAWLAG